MCAFWRVRSGGGRPQVSRRAGGRAGGWASACCAAGACPCATPCDAAGTWACTLARLATEGLPEPHVTCGTCSVVPHDHIWMGVFRIFASAGCIEQHLAAPIRACWTANNHLMYYTIAMLSSMHGRKRSPAARGRCGAPARRGSRAHCPGPVHVSPVPVDPVPPVSGVRIPLSAQGEDCFRPLQARTGAHEEDTMQKEVRTRYFNIIPSRIKLR